MDLLVASETRGAVLLYDGDTGALRGAFVPPGSGGLSQPLGMTLGPDGNVYVGSFEAPGKVLRYSGQTGAFIDVFISGFSSRVAHITFGPDGDLYGTLFDAADDLDVFRADGSTGALVGYIGAGSPLDGASGIAFGPDGNLYVGSWDTNQIQRFDGATGAYLDAFVTLAAPLVGVAGIGFGPDGRLCAALWIAGDVFCFDGVTGELLGSIPANQTQPSEPFKLAWGPDGDLYVSSSLTNSVLRYDYPTLDYAGVFASSEPPSPIPTPIGPVQGLPGSGLQVPSGITFLAEPPGPFPPDPPGVLKYRGIRYAEPPVRWQRPVRRAVSATTIDATAFGPACAQGRTGQPVTGSEDCLTLNIWRPESPTVPPPLPVLVYIHGGALVEGGASWTATEASDLALRQNLVVVEIQYRLGVFGFFGLPELAAEDPNGSTGNYGFLDQLEALGWVQDNIAAFGGDPNNVTIAGESAGGWSVCVLMASPLSNGLFQRGIVQSGHCQNALPLEAGPSAIADPVVGTSVHLRAQAVATAAGCPAGAGQLACLRNGATTTALVQALAAQPPSWGFRRRDPRSTATCSPSSRSRCCGRVRPTAGDFDYNNLGASVTATDFNDMKASVGKLVSASSCGAVAPGGSGNTQRCGEFDHDGAGATVTAADFNATKANVGKVLGTKCAACTQGTGWSNVLGPGARVGRPVCQSAVAGACVYAP
jgi:WD40 repeat protein